MGTQKSRLWEGVMEQRWWRPVTLCSLTAQPGFTARFTVGFMARFMARFMAVVLKLLPSTPILCF